MAGEDEELIPEAEFPKESEQIFARAKARAIEREADLAGRIIGVSQLKMSEQVQLAEWYPNMFAHFPLGPFAAQVMISAAVREIGPGKFAFPRTREELISVMDELNKDGAGGLEAAMTAFNRQIEDRQTIAERKAQAKNSPRTPASG